jgi:hypothetical protein
MDRSSKAITLALIGTAVLFGGCGNDEENQEQNNGQATAGHRGGGVMILPRIGGGGGNGGVATSPSARGGFGSTAPASVGE